MDHRLFRLPDRFLQRRLTLAVPQLMQKTPYYKGGWKAIGTVGNILRNLSEQQKFLSAQVAPILQEAQNKNDGSLNEDDFKKINRYYGLAVPAILGEAFCTLQGRKMTSRERWAATAQGAMTGLFDDFFDKDFLTDEAVKQLMNNPDADISKRSNEQLFNRFYSIALQHCADPLLLRKSLEKVFDAQVKSKAQSNGKLSTESLQSITFEKGGLSLLFYRSAFAPLLTSTEETLFYELGAAMQLCNDIFDVYKDREAGIQTMITDTRHISPVREILYQKIMHCRAVQFSKAFHPLHFQRFFDYLSVSIFNRAMICLDQLEANQQSTGNQFNVHAYSRAQLICDMDTMKNKLRSAFRSF